MIGRGHQIQKEEMEMSDLKRTAGRGKAKPKKWKYVSVDEEVYDRLDNIRTRREKGLRCDLSWNVFLAILAKEEEERERK